MIYRLIILTGQESGRRITVEQTPMTIGSGSDCNIVVKDEEAARKHAVIEHSEKGLYIRDLHTMHKILVNQHEVRECRLKHGDEIELGRTRFLVQATVKADVDGSEIAAPPEEFRERRPVAGVVGIVLVLAAVIGGIMLWLNNVQRDEYAGIRDDEKSAGADISDKWATSVAVEVKGPMMPNAALPNTNAVAPDNDIMSNELQRMNRELTGIRALVQELAGKQPPPTDGVVTGSQADIPDIRAPTSTANAGQPEIVPEPIPTIDTSKIENTTATPEAAPPANAIKIISVDQNKFPRSEDYEEMRALNIDLQLDSAVPIEIGKVRVAVSFFDRSARTGKIAPTTAVVPKTPLKIMDEWQSGRRKAITAMYVVPKTKAGGAKTAVRSEEFYGFVIKVYYAGKLQDQTARPSDLLNHAAGKLD